MSIKIGPYALLTNTLALLRPASVQELETPLAQIMWIHRNINWWIGDAINHGLAHHGDDFWQAIDPSFSEDHLNRCSRVAAAYAAKDRHQTLSWSQHQEAMVLSPVLRKAVLGMAEINGWKTRELKQYIEQIRQGATPVQFSSQADNFAG